MGLVSFVQMDRSIPDAVADAIEKALALIKFDFNRKADEVAIKPNMCYYFHPSTGEVTDPKFVGAIIDVLRKNLHNPRIYIVESDASAMKCKYAFHMLGYDKLAWKKKVQLINLSKSATKHVDTDINGWHLRFMLPELLTKCDLLINVPKIKYMKSTKITCALKNMYGCNAHQEKSIYHTALSEAIVGFNKLLKADLIVADGTTVLGKETKRLDMVMASEDPVSFDAAAARLMGISPNSVKQLSLAAKRGLGQLDFTPVGEFSYFKRAYPRKGFRDNLRQTIASAYLRVVHEY